MESDRGPKRRQDRNPGPVAKNLHLDHDFPIFGMILCGVEGDRVVDVKSEAYVDGQTDRAHTGSAHTGSAYTGSARIDRAHDEAMDVAAISRGRSPRLTGCPWHDVNEMLQSVGLRPTRQRMALGWLLFGKGARHLTAEMLYEEASNAKVPVSLATVYNTLNQLTDAGLLRQVSVDGTKTYFDTNVTAHHHFYIENTHELVDIHEPHLVLQKMPEVPDGYEISRGDMVVRLRKKR